MALNPVTDPRLLEAVPEVLWCIFEAVLAISYKHHSRLCLALNVGIIIDVLLALALMPWTLCMTCKRESVRLYWRHTVTEKWVDLHMAAGQ